MVIKPEKFCSNSERIAYLIDLNEDRQGSLAKRLAWEWLRTEVFDKHDFETFLDAWALSAVALDDR